MSKQKWTDEKAVRSLRHLLNELYGTYKKFDEPARTYHLKRIQTAYDALDHINTKLEIESPSLYQQIDLFA